MWPVPPAKCFVKEVTDIRLTGLILKGRYCILEQISTGGEGTLYLARDLELGCLWAVKEIPVSHKKEAKLLRLLDHPYMPRMIDYVEKEEYCYLVMEFIQGKSLEEWKKEGRRFSEEELLSFGIMIAQVLGYLHSRKPPVYYGDLKPGNLMLTQEGKLYLVDFGSAVQGYSRQQKECWGTVGYASPEQLKGQICEKSDIYTLGKTILALLTGNPVRYILHDPLFMWFLFRCCRKKEAYRYKNMQEVEKILKSIQKKKGRGRYAMAVAGITALGLVAAGILLAREPEKMEFWEQLTQITEVYYQLDFQDEPRDKRIEAVGKVRDQLQDMLTLYTKKEEQEYVLQMLRANEELLELWKS